MVEISSDTLRMAIILGVVLPGIGHMYLGQVKRGIKIVIALVLSGTISGVAFSYFVNITSTFAGGSSGLDFLFSLISPAISLIPLTIWIWQIKDLRRVIKQMTGHSIEELEPPHLEGGSYSPKEISVCPDCGKSINKNLQICDNCGFKL